MVDPLPAVGVPQDTVVIAGTAKATPTTVYTASNTTNRTVITGLTFCNPNAPGSAEQFYIGKRLASNSGATWNIMFSFYLDGGESVAWEGQMYLSRDDVVVAYGDSGSMVNVTPELGELV